MKIKEEFLHYGSFDIRDVNQIRFWKDTWVVGQRPFKDQYPIIYNIAYHPHMSVVGVMNTRPLIFGG